MNSFTVWRYVRFKVIFHVHSLKGLITLTLQEYFRTECFQYDLVFVSFPRVLQYEVNMHIFCSLILYRSKMAIQALPARVTYGFKPWRTISIPKRREGGGGGEYGAVS